MGTRSSFDSGSPRSPSSKSGYSCSRSNSSKYKEEGETFTQFLKQELSLPNNQRKTKVFNYQIEAVLGTAQHFIKKGTESQIPLIVAPTGAGKSGMVAMLPYVLESKKVLVLSPSLAITRQLADTFGIGPGGYKKSFFCKAGIVTDENVALGLLEDGHVIRDSKDFLNTGLARLVIVNAQKFGGRSNISLVSKDEQVVEDAKEAFKSFDTLIVDEAHHYPAKTWHNIVKLFHKHKKIVFLTATPKRRQNGKLVNILGKLQEVTYEVTKEQVQGKSIRKSEFRELKLSDAVSTKKGIFQNQDKMREIGDEIRTILAEHDAENPSIKHKAMVFVYTRKEAHLCGSWLGGAIPSTSEKNTENNEALFSARDGTYSILVSCGKFVEGYDNPDISVCVILRNVGSTVMFSQFVGRCMRVSSAGDPTTAVICSLPCFGQYQMWEQYEKAISETDPEEADDPAPAEADENESFVVLMMNTD